MKNMKKTTYIWAITLVIAGLVITSATSIPAAQDAPGTSSVSVKKLNLEKQTLEMAATGEVELQHKAMTTDLYGAFEFEGDQLHPGFGRSGAYMSAAFYDEDLDSIIWTGSDDDGATFLDGVYWDLGGDYPSIKTWDNSPRFFGTFVTDYFDLNGGATYLFECTDPMGTETYAITYWDWSGNGWYDMMDADIACDNSENIWEWGISSYVISSTYGDGYTDGPTITYSDEEDEGSGWISWYYYDGCAHTDVDIDPVTHMGYVVYDWEDTTAGVWKLLVRKIDFATIETGYDVMFEITGTGNLNRPAIAAYDDQVIILAETDENGNKDIVCLYTDTGDMTALQTSFVADSSDDEVFPDVRHAEDDTYVCTFVSDGVLYRSTSEDGGATWSDPAEIDECVEEYKTADITDFAAQAMYELDNGADVDIWRLDPLYGILTPILEITSITGGIGVTATVKNKATATAAATDVELGLTVTGGILGLINKNVSDTVASLAIDGEATISSGLIFGLGAVEIVATVTCAEGSSDEETADGTQIIIFTNV